MRASFPLPLAARWLGPLALIGVARAASAEGAPSQPPPTESQQYGQPSPPAAFPPAATETYTPPPSPSGYGQPAPQQNYGQPPPQQSYGQPPPSQYSPPPSVDRSSGNGGERIEEPPVPPPRENDPERSGFKMPPWSVRIDPFNWLLEGRFGLELEVGITKWMTAELVPVFVVSESPPTLSFHDVGSQVKQESNGPGALSGTSLGLGFWLGGKAFHGYVFRAIFQNYGYEYQSFDGSGNKIDQLTHTDRVLMGMLGSHTMFGPFTIAGGIGLGVDLNKQQRCYANNAVSPAEVKSSGCDGLQLLLAPADGGRVDVSSPFYPVVIAGRISLGITIE